MVGPASFLAHVLAHHDPTAAQGADGIRAWLGQGWVHSFSVVFHTTGALLVAGGLAAVLLMRSLPHLAEASPFTPRSRFWVRSAVLSGWGLNFLGGAMRLFEPDHPGLASFGTSAWVQILVFKHLALLAAVGLSLLAIELGPENWTRRIRRHAAVALVLVVVASISGGAATTAMGPMTAMPDGGMAMDAGDEHVGHITYSWHNASVDLSGATLLTPKQSTLPLPVPEGASEILVRITWTNDQSIITATLVDPTGEVVAQSGGTTATSAEVTADKNVTTGDWTVRIASDRAVAETVTVTTRITQGGSELRVLEETVSLTRGFEINLYMDPGEYFNYTWSVASGDPAIPWDIHSHPNNEVVTHHEGRDTSAEGTFVAGPNEVYSIYWTPEAGQLVTLTYRVEGNFTVHSIYR